MSSAPVIRARALTKEYLVHRRQATTLKELAVRNFFRQGDTFVHKALDGLDLELPAGTSLGVIGGNGSGKSTLLKLVTGIIQPTSGSLEVSERVAALLELGAGFQPEFTGMENIFLQCSIMGLSRQETLDRLDDIIEFSQLEKFIHTPVKRYSSGMYVRLGFAVAVHVDAEILVLDEVLSVGDQTFQVKSLQKIHELREQGKTVLFVSHSTDHVESVAERVLWLKAGRAAAYGPAEEVLPKYYAALSNGATTAEPQGMEPVTSLRRTAAVPSGRFPARKAGMQEVTFHTREGGETHRFRAGEPIVIRIRMETFERVDALELSTAFGTVDSIRALWSAEMLAAPDRPLEPGSYQVELVLEDYHLMPGRYLVSLMLAPPGETSAAYDLHLRLYAVTLWQPDNTLGLQGEVPRLTPWWRQVAATGAASHAIEEE